MTDLISFCDMGGREKATKEILAVNDDLKAYGGLVLTHKNAVALVETRTHALRNYGRVEFGGGIIPKIARAFCTSPDITKDDFPTVLAELIEIFYAYKNDTDFKISDDELIAAMRQAFDGSCHGSVELLASAGAQRLLRLVINGEEEKHPDDAPLRIQEESDE